MKVVFYRGGARGGGGGEDEGPKGVEGRRGGVGEEGEEDEGEGERKEEEELASLGRRDSISNQQRVSVSVERDEREELTFIGLEAIRAVVVVVELEGRKEAQQSLTMSSNPIRPNSLLRHLQRQSAEVVFERVLVVQLGWDVLYERRRSS